MKTPDLRVGLYARVSDPQPQKDTIASQIEMVERRIGDDGLACDRRCCMKGMCDRTGRFPNCDAWNYAATRSLCGIPWWVMMFNARHRTPASVAC